MKNNSNSDILNIIIGPGQHGELIVNEAIQKEDYREIRVFRYYPKYEEVRYVKGKKTIVINSKLVPLAEKFIGIFRYKLKIAEKLCQQLFFDFFDWYVSKRIKTGDLHGWILVSFISMKKIKKKGGSIILEYPIIHINSWQSIMLNEYDKYKIKHRSNLFTGRSIKKNISEIEISDQINILSTFAAETFKEHMVPEEKVNFKRISIDNEFLKHPVTTKRKKKSINEPLILLFVGRIDLLKGVHHLLEAFSNIKKENIELWLVGDKKPEIEFFYNKFKNDNIKFLGQKNRAELVEIYLQSDILILPSVQEAYGLVIEEALHFGLSVIASNHTGGVDLKEKFKDRLHIFNFGEIADLEKTILVLYQNYYNSGSGKLI